MLNVISPLNICKSKTVFAIALFLIGQLFVSAHAIEYGNQPHEHNGTICLAILNDEPEGLLSPNQLVTPILAQNESESFPLPDQSLLTTNPAITPPSTGPPSI